MVMVALNKFPITGKFILEIGKEIKKAITNPTISPAIAITISEVGVFCAFLITFSKFSVSFLKITGNNK